MRRQIPLLAQPRYSRTFSGSALLRAAVATWLVGGAFACSDSEAPPQAAGPQEPALTAGCNPLGGSASEDCFTPFPSSYYTESDDKGVLRVKIPIAILPKSGRGVPIDPSPLNGRDGFSPATPLLAYFPATAGAIDPKSLPGQGASADSVKPGSPVQLFRYDTGERVPILAEVDRNASADDRQALIIYPHVRLEPHTRYVVAVTGLKSSAGQLLAPLSGFAALRDGKLDAGSTRSAVKPRFEEIFALLAKQGLGRQSLQLAWDFTTSSDEPIYGRLLSMRDRAFVYKPAGTPPPAFTITTVNNKPTDPLYRQIVGTFSAPSFLTDDVNGRLMVGADGEPPIRGIGQFALAIHIPKCALTAPGPLPVMIYGHGLFGGALDEMDSGYQREIINRLCMVQIGTDWIGLADADQAYVVSNVLNDFNNVRQITERLQQAHVNFAYLSRLVATGALDSLAELQVMGKLSIDKSRLYYYGISNGGIQGATALALSPYFQRGALCVPGGFWSRMMMRSADFLQLAQFLGVSYPDALDRQILLALSQGLWDYSDPATYAPHLLQNPLTGAGGTKRLLYQEGLGDAQVPNMATRAMVRTMGLPLLNKPIEALYGIRQVDGPVDSAYVQYDIGQAPRPGDTNVPPDDNPVHEAIRRLEAAKQQLQTFLQESGKVTDSCNAMPCLFPHP